MTARKHFILTIDGGGVRGLIPLRILESLESRLRMRGKQEPLFRYFDLIGAGSTGAIIAAGLAAPKPDGLSGHPAATIAELRRFYEVDAREVFCRRGLLDQLTNNPLGLFDQKYDERPLERLLKERLGWTSLASAHTHVVFTAYDIGARAAVFMTNGKKRSGHAEDDYYFWQAVRAAMASPTYFAPARVENLTTGKEQVLIDGGVFMNNPVLAAYIEARKLGWQARDIVILSLGCGQAGERGYSFREASRWGAFGWLGPRSGQPLLSIVMHAQATTAAYQADWLFSELGEVEHIRLDGALSQAVAAMDNARPGQIIELNGIADRIIRDNTLLLDALAERMEARSEKPASLDIQAEALPVAAVAAAAGRPAAKEKAEVPVKVAAKPVPKAPAKATAKPAAKITAKAGAKSAAKTSAKARAKSKPKAEPKTEPKTGGKAQAPA